MEDVAAIVAKLTKAQREALCGIYSFASPMEEEDGEYELVEWGLWNELFGLSGEQRLTPRGLAVRTYLLSQTKE